MSDKKGINRQGGGLSAPALTDKDIEDISVQHRLKQTMLPFRFQSPQMIFPGSSVTHKASSKAWVIAKIERVEAIRNLNEILDASHGLMVARGILRLKWERLLSRHLQKNDSSWHVIRISLP